MRIFNVIVAGAASAAVLGSGMACASAPAQASSAPVTPASSLPVLIGSMGGSWYSNGVRPQHMVLGALWTMHNMTWAHWNHSSAYGHGTEEAGGYNGKRFDYRWQVRITLSDVKTHHGRPYYAHMKMVGHAPRGVPDVQQLVVRGGVMYYR